MKKDSEQTLREEAWIGDAVLGLYARQWLLAQHGRIDTDNFVAFTSNQFLSGLGEPTTVEAAIGRIYSSLGLEAAFSHIEKNLLPLFEKQAARRQRGRILATNKKM
ncbi:MAG: hypothetical protein LBV12_09115 [Puniceicoccales bacterium]|jgi:dsRNA-specific ribonuclease|nr:hypothetical protein [Puniceicoccales bacterium]